MIRDEHLTFLATCSSEDLDPLVGYVLSARSSTLAAHEKYRANKGNHAVYADVVVDEIRRFGGNSLVNVVRRDGVTYATIVRDVADNLGVKYEPPTSTDVQFVEDLEVKILTALLERGIEKMSDADRGTLEDEFRRAGVKEFTFSSGVPVGLMLVQGGVQLSGFLAYRIAVIVANAVARQVLGRGLSLAANASLTKLLGVFAGPVGWGVTGLWTVVDLSGPAYRVTIPVVCQVGYLRQKQRLGPDARPSQ